MYVHATWAQVPGSSAVKEEGPLDKLKNAVVGKALTPASPQRNILGQ